MFLNGAGILIYKMLALRDIWDNMKYGTPFLNRRVINTSVDDFAVLALQHKDEPVVIRSDIQYSREGFSLREVYIVYLSSKSVGEKLSYRRIVDENDTAAADRARKSRDKASERIKRRLEERYGLRVIIDGIYS